MGGFGCVNSSESFEESEALDEQNPKSFEDSEALDEQNMLSFAVDLRWLHGQRV